MAKVGGSSVVLLVLLFINFLFYSERKTKLAAVQFLREWQLLRILSQHHCCQLSVLQTKVKSRDAFCLKAAKPLVSGQRSVQLARA